MSDESGRYQVAAGVGTYVVNRYTGASPPGASQQTVQQGAVLDVQTSVSVGSLAGPTVNGLSRANAPSNQAGAPPPAGPNGVIGDVAVPALDQDIAAAVAANQIAFVSAR